MRKVLFLLMPFFAVVLFSCVDNEAYVPGTQGNDSKQKADYFDFATTKKVQVNVKYEVPKGYNVLFEVYAENPYEVNEDGQTVRKENIEPIFKRMTDGEGVYSGNEEIPAYVENVYIYTSYIGVPSLYVTKINQNNLTANVNWKSVKSLTRDAASDQDKFHTITNGLKTMGTWTDAGRPNYLDSKGQLTLQADFLKRINAVIPEGGTCPAKYRQDADLEILDDSAEVKVRFVGGTSAANSTFGYYCYEDAAEAGTAAKYIVFPNTKTGVALTGGECVKLRYIDREGVDRGTTFPKGVKIGWFLCNDSYNSSWINKSGGISNGFGRFYSTTSLNSDGRTHTVAFRIGDFTILSFEDWNDQDYNDIMFNIWSNPKEAIKVPDADPDINPDTEAYVVNYKGVMAFEDLWPSKGDYDMNDVVVRYSSVLHYNANNEVMASSDSLTLLWCGAQLTNCFGYQLNADRSNSKVTILEGKSEWANQGVDQDLDQTTVMLFPNAMEATAYNTKTPTYVLHAEFNTPIDHETYGIPPYNPFIVVEGTVEKNRKEVHFVNYKPTEKFDISLLRRNDDRSKPELGLYYVSDVDFPFAINLSNIDYFVNKGEGKENSINKIYPRFSSWASSKGMQDADWYLTPGK